ncbi:MAG: hypothetical protein ABIL49_01485 [candidate division WOR-3 bacterium]|jgi:diaminopimelate epimerase
MSFIKIDACGNDFIAVKEEEFIKLDIETIKLLCDRKKGIGADGVISPLKSNEYDFAFKYINYLGFEVPFCGHAIRCLTFYAYYIGQVNKLQMSIITPIGPRKTIIKEIKDKIAFIGLIFENFEIGVKHYVRRVENVENFELEKEKEQFFKISDEHFNIYSEIEVGKISVRTWEYGRDREELSCATGALACALNYNKNKNLNYIEVIPKSKKPIYIEILKDKAILWSYVQIIDI